MPVTLISSNPTFTKDRVGSKTDCIAIAELFGNTIQGEGINAGVPATFLRVKDCTLDCVWCDTLSVWKFGNWYTHEEVFEMFEKFNLIEAFRNGQHLILTGGSPLKQSKTLVTFIEKFIERYSFKPYIEVENEVVLMPGELTLYVDCWNNSPKLANSGMEKSKRLKPEYLKYMSRQNNSWFKFVISSRSDWDEIVEDFLPHIKKEQIILMPCGENQIELNSSRELVAELAVEHAVRMTDRLHVTIWDKKTGV
jgi:7-carboxy-7-deazaguanine synthase